MKVIAKANDSTYLCEVSHDEPVKVPNDDLAHEIWAAAQTAPGEGIEDAVERVAALLAREAVRLNAQAAPAAQGEPSDTERLDWLATRAKRWRLSGDGYYRQELRFDWGDSLKGRTLREAIDDARAAQQKGGAE